MTDITATELTKATASFVQRAEAGESFDVTFHGRIVARILPPLAVEQPVPWKRSPGAGTAGSPMAADGRHHIREFPCPDRGHYRLSADRRMWLEDYPPLNLKTVDRVLAAAYTGKRR